MKKFPHQQFMEDNQLAIATLPEMLQKRIKGFDELEEDLRHTTDEDKEKNLSKLETLSQELDEDLEEHFEDHLENNDREEDEQPEVIPAAVNEHILAEADVELISEIAEEHAVETKEEEIRTEQAMETLEELTLETNEEEIPTEPAREALEELTPKTNEEEIQVDPIQEPVEETVSESEEEPKEAVTETAKESVEVNSEPEPTKEPTNEEILESLLTDKKQLVYPLDLKKKGFKGDLQGRTMIVGKFCLHRGKYDTCYKIILKSQ